MLLKTKMKHCTIGVCSKTMYIAVLMHTMSLLIQARWTYRYNNVYKSLCHNTIGKNASQYTVNKLKYIHSLYINKYNDI